jgi:hypothetical protein
MQKHLSIIGILLLLSTLIPPLAQADTHTATNCEETGAGSIGSLATPIAADTDATVNIIWPGCTGGSSGHWTAPVSYTIHANATLVTLTAAGDTSIGGGDQTIIFDDYDSENPLFTFNTNATTTAVVRLTGFTIKGGTSAGMANPKADGVISIGGHSRNFRLDHVTVDGQTYSPVTPNSLIQFTNHVTGVIDHSIIRVHSVGNGVRVFYEDYNGGSQDDAFAAVTGAGGLDAIVMEDNVVTSNSQNAVVNDCFKGGKMVVRFNDLTSVGVQTHSTSTFGRGCRATEVYLNHFLPPSDPTDHPVGAAVFTNSGTAIVFGNQFDSPSGYNHLQRILAARYVPDEYNELKVPEGWGFSGGTPVTGVVNTSSTMNTVTWVSGTQFNTSWGSRAIIINGTSYKTSSIASATSLTLTADPGNQSSKTYIVGSNWDGNTDITGYPSLDQACRGAGDLLSGDFPTRMNGMLDPSMTNAWPNQALEPCYNFLNTTFAAQPGFPNADDADGGANNAVKDRDYFLTDNTNCVSGMGCTAGVGSGTTLPTTCTLNTGFWKTNVGAWRTATPVKGVAYAGQGVLYRCVSTNTWSAYYTPLTYPHPLISDTPAGGPAPAATGVMIR